MTSLVAQQLDLDTYREQSITGRAGISQQFGERLTGDLFAEVSRARFEDDFGIRHFPPSRWSAAAQYDRRDDPLDATRGYYLAAEVRPFYEAEFGNAGGARHARGAQLPSASAPSDRFVLAGRAKVGSYCGRRASPRARRTCCSSPAAAARCAAMPTARSASRPSTRRRRHRRGRRPRPVRGLGRAALPDQRALRRRRLRRRGHRDRGLRASGRRATCASAPASACATSPASDRCASTWRRRSTRGPEDSARGALHRDRTGVLRRIAALLGVLRARGARRAGAGARRRPTTTASSCNLLEQRLSAPGRQIRLSGITGALSSRARIARDHHLGRRRARGSRSQRRDRLEPARAPARPGQRQPPERRAHRLAAPRRAAARAAPPLPQAEAQPFALPELPVSIRRATSSASPASASPRRSSARPPSSASPGALDLVARRARHHARRSSAATARAAQLDLEAAFSNADPPARRSTWSCSEPQGGLVATLLRIEDRPAIDLTPGGRGPARRGRRRLRARRRPATASPTGWSRCAARDDGLGFDADFSGGLAPLIPAQFRDFFAGAEHGAGARREQGRRAASGSTTWTLAGAVLRLDGRLETGAGRLPAQPEPDRHARRPGRAGGGAAGAGRRAPGCTRRVLYVELRRRHPLERARGARPAGGGRHRDGGRDADAWAGWRRTSTTRRAATSPSTSRGSPPASGRPTRRSRAALGTRIDLFADAALPPGGPVDAAPAPAQRQRPLDLHRRHASRTSSTPAATRSASPTSRSSPASPGATSAAAIEPAAPTAACSPLSGGFDLTFDGGADRPAARRPAPRPAARRRDHARRPGGARRGRLPHREPAAREPAVLLRLRRPHRQRPHRHRLRRPPRRPRAGRSARSAAR